MKQTLLALLGLVLLFTPLSTRADQYGDLTYSSNGSAITITGYTGAGGAVTIPGTINNLAVTRIESYAFFNRTGLTGITFPDSLTSIGEQAFAGCTGLTSVAIPGSVTSIANAAFAGCTGLTAISVDADNTVYRSVDGVLFNKDQTTLIQYPGGGTGGYHIPGSVTHIGDYAFYSCAGLTSVTVPSTVTSIGDYAFASCTGLTAVYFGGDAPSLGSGVFGGGDQATVYHLPGTAGWTNPWGTLPTAWWYPYTYTTNNNTITITKYTGLGGAVTIPATINGLPVTSIGAFAFEFCASLTSVTIPASVTSIGREAFALCTGLGAITVDTNSPAYSSVDGVLFNKDQTTLIQYPGAKTGGYTIPGSVTSIGGLAFEECTGLTSVTIPNRVTVIGEQAFAGCSSLTNVVIPNSVVSIGDLAFFGCTGLASVTIPSGVTSIGARAFHGTSLTSVTIPSSVTSIGEGAFDTCPSLSAIAVAPGNPAFSSVDGVLFNQSQTTLVEYPAGKTASQYTIPSGVTSIGASAFYECTSLTSITIPAGVTNIGPRAFVEIRPTSLTIPASVTSIGEYAFYFCPNLRAIYFEGNAPSLGQGVFNGDNNVTVYYLPGTADWTNPWGGFPTALWNPLWADATDLGGGWKWLDWFGCFNTNYSPWTYHQQHGWLYAVGTDTSSIFFWDPAMQGGAWWWTSATTYPYLYRFSDSAWLWFQKDSANPRWFNNLTAAKWESW